MLKIDYQFIRLLRADLLDIVGPPLWIYVYIVGAAPLCVKMFTCCGHTSASKTLVGAGNLIEETDECTCTQRIGGNQSEINNQSHNFCKETDRSWKPNKAWVHNRFRDIKS